MCTLAVLWSSDPEVLRREHPTTLVRVVSTSPAWGGFAEVRGGRLHKHGSSHPESLSLTLATPPHRVTAPSGDLLWESGMPRPPCTRPGRGSEDTREQGGNLNTPRHPFQSELLEGTCGIPWSHDVSTCSSGLSMCRIYFTP